MLRWFLYTILAVAVLLTGQRMWVYHQIYHYAEYEAGAMAAGASEKEAKTTIVAFVDYTSRFSREINPVILQAVHDNPGIRVVFHPLPQPSKIPMRTARVALAAGLQDKFLPVHEALMRNEKPLTDEYIRELAAQNGMDADKFLADIDGNETAVLLYKSAQASAAMKVYATPAFIFNRKHLYIPEQSIPNIVEFNQILKEAQS